MCARLCFAAASAYTTASMSDSRSTWQTWAEYGVLGVEMEAAELYTLAAKFGRKALAVLTASDHILLGTKTTAEERQTSFSNMVRIGLDAVTV